MAVPGGGKYVRRACVATVDFEDSVTDTVES